MSHDSMSWSGMIEMMLFMNALSSSSSASWFTHVLIPLSLFLISLCLHRRSDWKQEKGDHEWDHQVVLLRVKGYAIIRFIRRSFSCKVAVLVIIILLRLNSDRSLVCTRYKGMLWVDEAHQLGITFLSNQEERKRPTNLNLKQWNERSDFIARKV